MRTFKLFDADPTDDPEAQYLGFARVDQKGVIVEIEDNPDLEVGERLKGVWGVLVSSGAGSYMVGTEGGGEPYEIEGVGPYALQPPIYF